MTTKNNKAGTWPPGTTQVYIVSTGQWPNLRDHTAFALRPEAAKWIEDRGPKWAKIRSSHVIRLGSKIYKIGATPITDLPGLNVLVPKDRKQPAADARKPDSSFASRLLFLFTGELTHQKLPNQVTEKGKTE